MGSADTIFALSSGAPPAAIAVMRISGSHAFSAVRALALKLPPPRRASLRVLRNPADGQLLDEALVLIFPGPESVTGEDLAEFHLHGGRAIVRAVEAALSALPDMRAAAPGEFTRRAFGNGRIDLNEAEGLADLLTAETEWQRRSAVAMAGGAFGIRVEAWRKELLHLSAMVEAELDFSDEDDVDGQHLLALSQGCEDLRLEIAGLLSHAPAEKLRDGLRVVLGGPPNCGKSTLLNALAGRDAAIVSDIAGTTRDLIEVPLALQGIAFVLVDTAGVHDGTDDQIEALGIDRARSAYTHADIILWLGDEDAGPEFKHLIEIQGKIDSSQVQNKLNPKLKLSAKTGEGLEALKAYLVSQAKTLLPPPDSFAVNMRQRRLLSECVEHLVVVGDAVDLLIIGEQLRLARLSLDALSGRTTTEDMLDTLFGRFCIGK
jgi:tRNA modification GTPase